MKCSIRILEAPVTMEKRMGIRICLDRCIKSTEYQIIIIRVAYDVGYDPPVV